MTINALVGDAAGSVLEKLGRKPTLQEVKVQYLYHLIVFIGITE
jgi:hypothetical protein